MRGKKAGRWAAAGAGFLLVGGAAFALMTGAGYSLFGDFFSGGGGVVQTAGGWTQQGSIGSGNLAATGGGYSLTGGVNQAARPFQASVNNAHAFPVPFRPDQGHTKITFTALTNQATIRIFTVAGRLVRTLQKNDFITDTLDWDVTNDSGQKLASGLYFYVIEGNGGVKQGKLIVIR